MITGFDISSSLYTILNVTQVTSIIDGKVYRERRPTDLAVKDLQNVVITPLINMVEEFVTEAVVNVNIYCKDLDNGQPNLTKLNSVASAVVALLNAYSSVSSYFSINIVSNQLVPDDNGMSFINLRLEIFTI